ncbi:hypothetical protein EDD58_103506 [Hazenella coriacea]|uniref:Uncharacterized protein n=1 Tax=Hazenella coriacea TaxID=1179467 RepID=A0A4R3L7W8_9BACL|nr:hypothetical protein EDD58_103506 [Hazenella coriacea]
MGYGRYGGGFGWRHLLLFLLVIPVIFFFVCGNFGFGYGY